MNKGNQLSGDGQKPAEFGEQRSLAEGNTRRAPTAETQGLGKVSRGLLGVREAARRDKRLQFTALLHHIDVSLLWESYEQLKRGAAPGVDGVRWEDYQEGLLERLTDLHDRIHKGSYRALPSKRARIAKEDGSERKLGIAALEDKIVQQAVATVLTAIYEEDFVGFSYGFRPGRDQHQALDALWVGLTERPINWVVDLDIQSFFDRIRHNWMVRFLEHRIADKRIIRLIRKWLRAGVMEEGQWQATEEGSPQGSVISPLLANIYLHYAFDLWVQQRRRREVRGAMIVLRYADDIVAGFQHEEEAEAFLAEVADRLSQFGLNLHPGKSRLIEFGRHAASRRKAAGLGKPETFDFLGFTHIAAKTRNGRFVIRRRTIGKRQRRKLQEIKRELRRRFQDPVPETGRWLRQVLQGYYRYFAVPYNLDALNQFRYEVGRAWLRALRRRSQKARRNLTWEKFKLILGKWLPMPRTAHPWPNVRFRRRYPRQEPCAVIPHARISTGGAS
jgi:group II intron reverse transcriptase/maturase